MPEDMMLVTRKLIPPRSGWHSPMLGGDSGFQRTGREPRLGGQHRQRQFSVVVVDDDPIFTELVSLVLTIDHPDRYTIHTFSNGWEAYIFCQKAQPDLLITDVRHPGIDGIELCRLIRHDPRLHRLPLIVQTACDSYRDQVEDDFGALYFDKPVDIADFKNAVSSILHPGAVSVWSGSL